jgi:hypothetical protein
MVVRRQWNSHRRRWHREGGERAAVVLHLLLPPVASGAQRPRAGLDLLSEPFVKIGYAVFPMHSVSEAFGAVATLALGPHPVWRIAYVVGGGPLADRALALLPRLKTLNALSQIGNSLLLIHHTWAPESFATGASVSNGIKSRRPEGVAR